MRGMLRVIVAVLIGGGSGFGLYLLSRAAGGG